MVRQWQDMFYNGRHMEVDFESITPDFEKLADSFGISCKLIDKPSDIESGLKEMLDSSKAFILVVRIAKNENVYPMIAPNAPHNEVILKP